MACIHSSKSPLHSQDSDLRDDLRGLPLFDDTVSGQGPQLELPGVTPPAARGGRSSCSDLDNGHIRGREGEVQQLANDLIPAPDPDRWGRLLVGPGGVKARAGMTKGRRRKGGGIRGKISGFSANSRRRLRALNCKVNWAKYPAYFCTLTYHDEYPLDWTFGTAHLKAFRKRLERGRLGRWLVAVEWRREFKKRRSGTRKGHWAPHIHMIVLLNIDIPADLLYRLMREAWHEVIGEDSTDHLEHGVHVEKCYNTHGPAISKLMTYLAKYVSKDDEGTVCHADTGEVADVGRVWGVWGKLPMAVASVSLDERDYIQLLRRMKSWQGRQGYANRLSVKWEGWLLFCDGVGWCKLLRGLPSVKYELIVNT